MFLCCVSDVFCCFSDAFLHEIEGGWVPSEVPCREPRIYICGQVLSMVPNPSGIHDIQEFGLGTLIQIRSMWFPARKKNWGPYEVPPPPGEVAASPREAYGGDSVPEPRVGGPGGRSSPAGGDQGPP